jgi:hypothetical protein
MRAWPWLRRALMRLVRRETARWTEPLAALRARHGLAARWNPLIEGQYSPHLNLAALLDGDGGTRSRTGTEPAG